MNAVDSRPVGLYIIEDLKNVVNELSLVLEYEVTVEEEIEEKEIEKDEKEKEPTGAESKTGNTTKKKKLVKRTLIKQETYQVKLNPMGYIEAIKDNSCAFVLTPPSTQPPTQNQPKNFLNNPDQNPNPSPTLDFKQMNVYRPGHLTKLLTI